LGLDATRITGVHNTHLSTSGISSDFGPAILTDTGDVCRSNAVGFQSYVEGFPVLKQCFRTIPIDMRQGGYGESAHVTDGKGLNAGKLW
jgi:hypothetical protein